MFPPTALFLRTAPTFSTRVFPPAGGESSVPRHPFLRRKNIRHRHGRRCDRRKVRRVFSIPAFPVKVVPISHETRTNLTISDKQGLTVKLNEFGPKIETNEFKPSPPPSRTIWKAQDWLMICGSLPPGVPAHFYSDLIELAHKRKVQTLLDTDGDALLHGLEAGPTMVTPNQQEAERLSEPCPDHPDAFFRRRGAHSRHGFGIRHPVARQPRRSGRRFRGYDRSDSTPHRRGLSHRRWRCNGCGIPCGPWIAREIFAMPCVGPSPPEQPQPSCQASPSLILSRRGKSTSASKSTASLKRSSRRPQRTNLAGSASNGWSEISMSLNVKSRFGLVEECSGSSGS